MPTCAQVKCYGMLSFFLSLMATKDTPKKFYPKCPLTEVSDSSRRLCKAVMDKKHCRDLFKSSNRMILKNAEEIHGSVLLQDQKLPHLICWPCERRLDNAIKFKKLLLKHRSRWNKSPVQNAVWNYPRQ